MPLQDVDGMILRQFAIITRSLNCRGDEPCTLYDSVQQVLSPTCCVTLITIMGYQSIRHDHIVTYGLCART